MNIIFYRNLSDVNYVDKVIQEVYTLTGSIIGECSVTDPVISIQIQGEVKPFNYFYIPEFGNRYYYVTNNTVVRTGVYEISGHVDVLMTYRDGIRNCSALINRQENLRNLYLDDDRFKVTARRKYGVSTFSNSPAGGTQMVLIAAGGLA